MANRHLSRSIVLQTLFEGDINGIERKDIGDVMERNVAEFAANKTDSPFMDKLLNGVLAKQAELDLVIEKAAPDNADKSDLELYAAKVEVDQKWDEVKQILVWTGHWDGYQKFVADRREQEKQARLKAIREAQKKRKNMQDIAIIIGGIAATVAVIAVFIWAIAQAKG